MLGDWYCCCVFFLGVGFWGLSYGTGNTRLRRGYVRMVHAGSRRFFVKGGRAVGGMGA